MSKRILLVVGGGIAAYKCLDLVRRLKERSIATRVVMTAAAARFVTPLSFGAISGDRVFSDLFDQADELDVGHVRLSREADLIVVAPATADLLAKLANGHADDLASAVLLATDKPVLAAPAMNPRMWLNAATVRNVSQLKADGVAFVGPNTGEMAEAGEAGPGRMAEPLEIAGAIERMLDAGKGAAAASSASRRTGLSEAQTPASLAGRHVLITAGPTHEPIDPVRYIANRSSGKQGYAIAACAAQRGARVTLVSGPVGLVAPAGVRVVAVETAEQMLAQVRSALPADIAIFSAAVADWRVAQAADEKIKKAGNGAPRLALVENPDILKTIAHKRSGRPALVVGFAAETENVIENARNKRKSKGCDWIIANDVSPETGVMGGDRNTIHVITAEAVENWPEMSKQDVAERLIERVAEYFELKDAGV
ncbi:MAG: bifunctional phosphopantothenoylcysteine decarboxylase/phosphopantothenate--cysteine ligase CoaBC [Hyphomicrobiaceae bacterium]